jgi:hypothetical protein
MLFMYAHRELQPLSILEFANDPSSYSQRQLIICEPSYGVATPCTGSCTHQLSSTDTSRTIHTIFKVSTFRLKQYQLWLLVSPTSSSALTKELIEIARGFAFTDYRCTFAIDPYTLFNDLKPFISFTSAFGSHSSPLRSSSPLRGLRTLVSSPISTRQSQQRAPLQTDFVHPPTFSSFARANECDLVVNGLYIGNESAARNAALLASLRITHIVNLNGCEAAAGFPDGYKYFVVKLRDSSWETLSEEFWEALQFVKDAIADGGCVLCHCRRGISRSAVLCIAFLMDTRGLTCNAALALLKQQRPIVDPGQGFMEQLKEREARSKPPESGRRRMLVPSLLIQ